MGGETRNFRRRQGYGGQGDARRPIEGGFLGRRRREEAQLFPVGQFFKLESRYPPSRRSVEAGLVSYGSFQAPFAVGDVGQEAEVAEDLELLADFIADVAVS